jgi:hypothetical protein
MMNRMLLIVLAGAMFLCLSPVAVRAELFHYPTEVTVCDPTKAYPGVHLFTPQSGYVTYLIDLDGRMVHKWKRPDPAPATPTTIWYAALEENGKLSRALTLPYNGAVDPHNNMTGGGQTGGFEEVNWNGTVAVSLNLYRPQFRSHHQYERIFNKKLNAYTYLVLCWEARTNAEGIALGALAPRYANGPGAVAPDSSGWSSDAIYELDYSGNIVWKWSLYDHTCQSVYNALPNFVADVSTVPNKWDVNAFSRTGNQSRTGPTNAWMHVACLGYDPATGHIAFGSREFQELFVVDHDGTFVSTAIANGKIAANIDAAAGAGGDFLYRFGAPMNYQPAVAANLPSWGSNGTVQIWGAHSVHFIKPTFYKNGPALPGAGHILVFDNHGTNNNTMGSFSQLLEINPHVTGPPAVSTSNPPVWPAGAAYKLQSDVGVGYVATGNVGFGYSNTNQSHQVVWKFMPSNSFSLSSSHLGGVQRLPNGNTIGTSGEAGHIFEVTPGTDGYPPGIGGGGGGSGCAGGFGGGCPFLGEVGGPSLPLLNPEAWYGTSPLVVWEYTNPISKSRTAAGLVKQTPVRFVYNVGMAGNTFSDTQLFTSFRYGVNYPGLKGRLVQYPDGTILPVNFSQPGTGFTLTGAVPCRNVPCDYAGTP